LRFGSGSSEIPAIEIISRFKLLLEDGIRMISGEIVDAGDV
jgi:hypothetical protein